MSRKLGIVATVLAAMAACGGFSTAAWASVTVLSGGDPGEGFSPAPVPVYPYNFRGGDGSGIVPVDIQGETFDVAALNGGPAAFSDFTITGNGGYDGGGDPDIGATANDDNLEYINRGLAFSFGAPFALTLENLTPGKSYQIDLFVETVDGSSYAEDFEFNGGQEDSFTALGDTYYDVSEDVVANGSGEVVVSLIPYPARLNAFAVTTTPEPASAGLLLVSGLALLGGRRRMR